MVNNYLNIQIFVYSVYLTIFKPAKSLSYNNRYTLNNKFLN